METQSAVRTRKELLRELVKELVLYGHRYERSITCEGSVESGPYALDFKCVRSGRIHLQVYQDGSMSVIVNVPRKDYGIWFSINHGHEFYKCLKAFATEGELLLDFVCDMLS